MKALTLNAQLLAIIGRRNPAIYDVVFPRGPLGRLAAVALNPQPIPPHELGGALAGEFVRMAWLAERGGMDTKTVLAELDDWCPTHPRPLKLPPWWRIPDPSPDPEWFLDFQLGFAAQLASVANASPQLRKSLDRAIDRSISAIEAASAKKDR
jgi:hypothetical protein